MAKKAYKFVAKIHFFRNFCTKDEKKLFLSLSLCSKKSIFYGLSILIATSKNYSEKRTHTSVPLSRSL